MDNSKEISFYTIKVLKLYNDNKNPNITNTLYTTFYLLLYQTKIIILIGYNNIYRIICENNIP